MVWTGPTTPQSAIDNWGRDMTAWESTAVTARWESLKPPRLAVLPELTADDVTWLNEQMALTERPPVRYARELPIPPLPPGIIPRPAFAPTPGELADLRDRFLAQSDKPAMWIS